MALWIRRISSRPGICRLGLRRALGGLAWPLALVLALVGSSSWAQPAPAPAVGSDEAPPPDPRAEDVQESSPAAPSARERAQALMNEGNAHIGEGDFGLALAKFRAAYALFSSPKLLLNIGTSLRHVGRNAEAAAVYESYLARPDAEARHVENLQRILGEIDAVVAKLRIEVSQPGARLRLDGKSLEPSQIKGWVRVDPGDHTIVAQKDGYQTAVSTLSVGAGEQKTVELLLLAPGESPPVVIERSSGQTQRTAGIVVGSLGLAGIALGAVFGGLYLDSSSELDSKCSTVDESVCGYDTEELIDTADTQATVANVGFIVGGAALVAGVVVFLTAPDDTESVVEVGALPGGAFGARWLTRW